MNHRALVGSFAGVLWAASCGGEASSTSGPSSVGSGASASASASGTTATSTGAGGQGGAGGAGGSATGTGGSGGGSILKASCSDEPPPGATLAPAPPAYSGGECPALVPGKNPFMSSGNSREFMLVVPADLDPNEKLPVIFLWHWLGGSADDFFEKGQVQAAADMQRFIAVIPEAKGDLNFKWPFDSTVTDARVEEEFVFFDDMLSCVSAKYSVNKECVSSAGVSAGALFTGQLAGGRGQYLSSILSLSGGVGGVVRPWKQPEHKMPAMVLWGGPTDQCFFVMNFENASKQLEKDLASGGHFFLECVHNCGHAEPPLPPPEGMTNFAALWQFTFDHPYWLKAGESPYNGSGVTPLLPEWCGIGAASATPRTGACPNPPGC